jgi:hypothetical protein
MGPSRFSEKILAAEPVLRPLGRGLGGANDALWPDGTRAVVKLALSKLPNGRAQQCGFPAASHPRREVAFFRLAKAFGWTDFVPETVLFSLGGVEASAQAWIEADHLSTFYIDADDVDHEAFRAACDLVPKTSWIRLVVLDFVAGQRDRHTNNVGVRTELVGASAKHELVAWDNATTFGKTLARYKEVFHRRLFFDRIDFDSVWGAVEAVGEEELRSVLAGLVSGEEIDHTCLRRKFLFDHPYRVPWRTASKGWGSGSGFPAWASFFKRPPEKIADLGAIMV